MNVITDQTTVGEIVATDYRTAEVFDKYRIDFCCQGRTPIAKACEKKNVDMASLVRELESAMQREGGEQIDFQVWPLDLLCDYIEKTHHRYVTDSIPVLIQFLDKVARVHGERHPELLEVNRLFREVADELIMHMEKEEGILFPYVRDMAANKRSGGAFKLPQFGTVQNPISVMEQEHEFAGNHLFRIADLTGQYTPPADACTTYRVAFAKLDEFERDLHRHVHLENNVLFPKAKRMEEELVNR